MRILFLNAGAALGGAERSLLDLMASLRQADPRAELHLAVTGAGPLAAQAEQLGVRVVVLPIPAALGGMGDSGLRGHGAVRAWLGLAARGPAAAWGACRYAKALRRLVADLRPDVVHSNSIKFHLLTGLGGAGAPAVVWHVRDFLGQRPLAARALRWGARVCGARVCGAVAISEAVADDARRVVPGVPVEVVYNAIDTDHFCPGSADGRELDALAGLPPAPPETVRVGLVATFARWKGHDIFLEATDRLTRDSHDRPIRCYLVGGPIYRTRASQWSLEELRARAPRGLGFIDFQQDPRAVYRGLDIVVHASTRPEPFGRTIVEAMACGRPVVAARAGGAAELFTHADDAIGVPPGDASALVEALLQLARDPGQRFRLGAAARRRAVAGFSRSRLGPQLLQAYRRFGVPVSSS